MSQLEVLRCLDSPDIAETRRRELDIDRGLAIKLGMTAVEAIHAGRYQTRDGRTVVWRDAIDAAVQQKKSLPPDSALSITDRALFEVTRIQTTNETTLGAARRLADQNLRPLALNFASGIHPGGGFLRGARAQEENLCRSSALYQTLVDDPMYDDHRTRSQPDSTDWAILSPDVPVFRADDGTELGDYWLLSFIACAAPVATRVGQPLAGNLLRKRIHRVLSIARAFEYDTLVLGAWGYGAFGNDPARTARDFREALESDFAGAFSRITFAITDWSPERRFLGPFKDVFS